MRALCGHCAGTVRALCGHCAGTARARIAMLSLITTNGVVAIIVVIAVAMRAWNVRSAVARAIANTVPGTIATTANMQHPSSDREPYSHSGVSENNAHQRSPRPATMHPLTPDLNVEDKRVPPSKRE